MKAVNVALIAVLLVSPALAQTKPSKPKPPQRHQLIQRGPFVTATIGTPREDEGITDKAIAISLANGKAGVLFDTDTCRLAAGWVGGFVNFTKDWTSVRDSRSVKLVGAETFGTHVAPGWANPETGAWRDPRDKGWGPLPHAWAHYRGLYVHDDRVVFSYTVAGVAVLESPSFEELDGQPVIARTLNVAKSDKPLRLLVAQRQGGKLSVASGIAAIDVDGTTDAPHTRIGLAGPTRDVRLVVDGDGVVLDVAPAATPVLVKLLTYAGAAADSIGSSFVKSPPPEDLEPLTKGGHPHWPQEVITTGVLNTSGGKDDPYVVDTLTLPDDNPYKSWMRPGGFDFFTSDPTRAAVCNWSGDVWVVSGIDASLKNLRWRRIADGLFQPLGLKIVNDRIYVVGRDQITILNDTNGDGETDFYENFTNDVQVTPSFHEFQFDLWQDPAGYLYTAKAGPVKNGGHGFDAVGANNGTVMRIAPDGSSIETYATGFRAPNGICVGPDGQVTTGDNEGSWVPMCRLNWLKQGGFYGVVPTAHRKDEPKTYDGPLCWFPKEVDNSSGCQVWVTGNQWGPFNNRLLHLSYGTCSLFLVLKEEVNGEVQGGVVRFPLNFDSGIMRARFNPADGQLYVAGLKGWQTKAAKDGCLQRVRYTGKAVHMPTSVNVIKAGMRIGFTCPLDAKDAADPGNYAVERWNYLWSEAYGSAHYSFKDPTKKGPDAHDPMEVKSATVSPDGRDLFLSIDDLQPVMQMKTEIRTQAADGAPIKFDLYQTVHQVGR